jgi:hypothetical protein
MRHRLRTDRIGTPPVGTVYWAKDVRKWVRLCAPLTVRNV